MTFSEFIAEKGVKPLSLVLGISEGTIYSWSSRDGVPRKQWDKLLEAYPRMRWSHLVEIERASRKTQGSRAQQMESARDRLKA